MRYFFLFLISLGLVGIMGCGHTDGDLSSVSETVQEPAFTHINGTDPRLKEARTKAATTITSFMKAFNEEKYQDASYLVKASFTGSEPSNQLHMWVALLDIKETTFVCRAIEVPKGFNGLEMGKDILLSIDEIEDWMINDSGRTYGAYSLRLQRERLPENQKASFDEYTGIENFIDKLP